MNTPITDAAHESFEDTTNETVRHFVDYDVARRLELDRAALMEALEHIARDQDRPMSVRVASPAAIAKAALAAARANFPIP